MAHIAPWKKEEVAKLSELAGSGSVVALATLESIPSKQMAQLRSKLRDEMTIRVSKNRLIKLALDNGTEGGREALDDLKDHMSGQTALVVTDLNPFKLYKRMEESKAKAPAKPGQIAPEDIWVKKGDTPFSPGPVVGELQQAGIPAAIDQGKVVIRQDKLMVKAGEPVPANVAAALAKLEIEPMTVGLEVKAAWESGTIFTKDVLAVDEEALVNEFLAGAANARGLATELAWITPETLPGILGKAVRAGRGVATETAYPAEDVLGDILAKAERTAMALAGHAPDLLDEETKAKLAAAQSAAAAAPAEAEGEAEAEQEQEEEEDEVSEEEAAAGLGDLFG